MSFKICSLCETVWPTREAMLADKYIEVIGYQTNFDDLEEGLVYFNHTRSDCGTTMALEVFHFSDLYHGERYQQRKTGTEDCPGQCLHKDSLDACPLHCECAYVRELLQILRNWPKSDQ